MDMQSDENIPKLPAKEQTAVSASTISDDTSNTEVESNKQSGPSQKQAYRPVKKARTAYFIFMDERRAEVQAAHPNEGVAGQAKALGHLWGKITDEEKKAYQLRAAEERERVAKEIQELRDSGMMPIDTDTEKQKGDTNNLTFPIARIRKICKLDPEVKGISKEAMLLIARSAELFTKSLGGETVKIAQVQNRRKLLPEDVVEICSTKEQFLFLREDLRDILKEQLDEKRKQKESAVVAEGGGTKAKGSEGSKPLTAYFGTAASSASS